MSIKTKYIPLFASMILLVSCSPVFEQEIQQVQSMYTDMQDLKNRSESFDSRRIEEVRSTYFELMDVVRKSYRVDTIGGVKLDQNFARMCNYYKGIKKGSGGYNESIFNLQDEIGFSLTQLESLEDDLKNGDITDKDSVAVFMQSEQDVLNKLKGEIERLEGRHQALLQIHDSAYPYFKNLVDSLLTQ